MIDLKSKEGITKFFVKAGYDNNPISYFDKEKLDFNYNWLKNVHLLSDTDDFRIWLFEVVDLKTDMMNRIARRFHKRNPFNYNLLIFTNVNYDSTVLLHYHRDNDGKIKIRRLKIEKNVLTATDIRILSDLRLTGKDIIDDLDIFKIHQDAFNIERVTNKFFEEFKVQVEEFSNNINGLKTNRDRKNYALLIVSRLIFLCFIQQKGWLNGAKNYLYDRLQYSILNKKNYFEDILQPLFFECLNTSFDESFFSENNRSQKARSLYQDFEPVLKDMEILEEFKGIPYLNGGLFEPDPVYEVDQKIKINNDLFKSLFDNLLNKYNFTVREDLGYDTDIAVDPELLGRIFENMIIEDERSSTGSFYTPREIISEMCKTSLQKYFKDKFDGRLNLKINYLIDYLEEENLYSKQKKIIVNELIQETKIKDQSALKMTKNEALKFLSEIKKVKICDPAVGSGAFILGMLHILVEIIRKVYIHSFGSIINIFETKRNIIQNNLYGVDREEGAIDIARLRIWLSLAVEYNADSIEEIPPLPNLTYKIMQGNSLFSTINGLDFDKAFDEIGFGQASLFEDKSPLHHKLVDLIEKRNAYFSASTNKKEIEKTIEILEKEILNSIIKCKDELPKRLNNKSLFSWKINFPEVFEKEGFDIIIGNPPYGAEFNNEEKATLKKMYPNVADYESSQYFYFRGLELLKKKGLISYITTNTFLFNVNAKKFRKEIISSSTLQGLYDLTDINVFKKAKVRTVIKYGLNQKTKNYNVHYYNFNPDRRAFYFKNQMSVKKLIKNDKNWLYMMRFSGEQEKLIEKISMKGGPLNDYFDISQGLIPYDKYRGHSQEIIKNRIWHEKFKKDETYKPELKGADVKNYVVNWNGKLWISYGDWLAAPREPKFFNDPRVLVREIVDRHTGRLNAGFTDQEFYNTPSIINIIPKRDEKISLFYLLGLLNSKLFAIYNYATSPKVKKGLFPKVLITDIRELPIKIGTQEQVAQIEDYVSLIVRTQKNYYQQNIENTQNKIDEIIFKIYGLDEEDQNVLLSIIE